MNKAEIAMCTESENKKNLRSELKISERHVVMPPLPLLLNIENVSLNGSYKMMINLEVLFFNP